MEAVVRREWVTYRQAEEISGLSRTTLWRLVKGGEVEAAKIGSAVRINHASLTAYLKRCSAGGCAAV